MEFNKKLQELRKQKNLTQEELAQQLYVSRTAVSKWESDRGYPSIDSLKRIAEFFSVTVDELLSGDEILTIAQKDSKNNEMHFRDMVYGLLDISLAVFFFLPLFGQNSDAGIISVSLLKLNSAEIYMKIVYITTVVFFIVCGIATLALQNFQHTVWTRIKSRISLAISIAGILIFITGRQAYAASLVFVFLITKAAMFAKHQ